MFTRISFALMVAMCATISLAPGAVASVQTGDIVRIGDGPGSPGGIFFLQDAAGNKLADTFCVQLDEYINFGKTYEVDDALATSTAGAGSRPLTSFAAWLFDRYLNGLAGSGPALSNFVFSNAYGQVDAAAARIQANELQLSIWEAMGYTPAEIGGIIPGGWYATYSGKIAGWNAEFQSDGAWSGTGDVYVLNLMGKDSNGNYSVHAQDQLVRISDSVNPEPVSAVIWSILAITVAGVARRRR
jgi:hypothetical protein